MNKPDTMKTELPRFPAKSWMRVFDVVESQYMKFALAVFALAGLALTGLVWLRPGDVHYLGLILIVFAFLTLSAGLLYWRSKWRKDRMEDEESKSDQILPWLQKELMLLQLRERDVSIRRQQPEPRSAPSFDGDNIPIEEWPHLSQEERGQFLLELEQRNKTWLAEKFKELSAGWVVIVDGQVTQHGADLSSSPTDEEIHSQGLQIGKYPFLFINQCSLAIEEPGSAWHPTSFGDDFYPTLQANVENGAAVASLVADFDTGSIEVYVDWDLLETNGVVQPNPADVLRFASHLNQAYSYLRRRLLVRLKAEDGSSQYETRIVICILNWPNSPFVLINPVREALVGRALCLSLAPQVNLNFAQRLTALNW